MLQVDVAHRFAGLDLRIKFAAEAGVTVLFGASGSGKTTVANMVAGLLRPDQGRIQLADRIFCDTKNGICLPPHRRRIGYIFQDGRLFPHLTVRQNIMFGQWFNRKLKPPNTYDRVVEMLGLEDVTLRRPARLSGGEKQRVAIARALLAEPELIIADEPLSALDQARKAEILPYFERLRDESKIPFLYISHSSTEVARLATSVVAMSQGRVLRQGDAKTVLGDPTVLPFGARGAGAVLETKVLAHHDDGLTELQANGQSLLVQHIDFKPGQPVRVRISAHDVILATQKPEHVSALNILPVSIVEIHSGEGSGVMISLRSDAGPFLARVTKRSVDRMGLRRGLACYAIVKSVAIASADIS